MIQIDNINKKFHLKRRLNQLILHKDILLKLEIRITVLLVSGKNAESLASQRPAMIAHLDEVRGFMEELSPELGVTDPDSGINGSKVGYHDR